MSKSIDNEVSDGTNALHKKKKKIPNANRSISLVEPELFTRDRILLAINWK